MFSFRSNHIKTWLRGAIGEARKGKEEVTNCDMRSEIVNGVRVRLPGAKDFELSKVYY